VGSKGNQPDLPHPNMKRGQACEPRKSPAGGSILLALPAADKPNLPPCLLRFLIIVFSNSPQENFGSRWNRECAHLIDSSQWFRMEPKGSRRNPFRGGVSQFIRCEAPSLLHPGIERRITPSPARSDTEAAIALAGFFSGGLMGLAPCRSNPVCSREML
jgi:hypothetical protein